MTAASPQCFLDLLDIVRREGQHLQGATARLAAERIDGAWVMALEQQPELVECVDA